jgi:homoserine O-succinyltransferase/O-acetyltransferase
VIEQADHDSLDATRSGGVETRRRERVTRRLEIGLVNNMPDATLEATERQFKDLIAQNAGDLNVRLHFFALPEIARGEAAAEHIRRRYRDAASIAGERLDGLIITGCEPKAPRLEDEPYWPHLTRLIDRAASHTKSTIFSCLAAHAATQYLDGVRRTRVERKYSGVFDSDVVADHPLVAALGPELRFPHSRLNTLDAKALAARDYEILSLSPKVGVDVFVRQQDSLMVFLQGHPEYDAESLLREYRRDVTRYLRGEGADFPALPEDYFEPQVESHLLAFAERVRAGKSRFPHREMASLLDDIQPVKTWRASAAGLYRNWLAYLAADRSR